MKSKGFTLIEIIVVIAILGVLSFIVTVSFKKTMESTEKNKCEDFIKEVEEAACVYASLKDKEIVCNRESCDPIPVSLLVKEGLIKSEEDACTNKEIDLSQTVTVTWNSTGEKICKFNRD